MTSDLHDFDIVLRIAESELDRELALQFATGEGEFPVHIEGEDPGSNTAFNFLFDTPWVSFAGDFTDVPEIDRYAWPTESFDDLDAPTDATTVTFFLPFSESSFEEDGDSFHDLDGCIAMECPLAVRDANTAGTAQEVLIDIPEIEHEDITIGFTDDTFDALSSSAAFMLIVGMTEGIEEQIEQFGDPYPVTPEPIDVAAGDDGTSMDPIDVQAGVIRAAGAGCIVLGMQVREDATPALDDFGVCPGGGRALHVGLDADTVLARLVRPNVADELGVELEHWDEPCELAEPIDYADQAEDLLGDGEDYSTDDLDEITLESFVVSAADGYFEIAAELSAAVHPSRDTFGAGLDATASLDAKLALAVNDGELDLDLYDISVAVDLTAVGTAIVLPGELFTMVELMLEALIESQIEAAIADGMGAALSEDALLDGTELGPAAAGIYLQSAHVGPDAIELAADIILDDAAAIRHHVSVTQIDQGSAKQIDLDAGEVSPYTGSVAPDTDLVWTGTELELHNGARGLPIPEPPYEVLTVVDVEQHDYTTAEDTALSAADLGLTSPSVSITPGGGVTATGESVGIATSEGRFAKCRIDPDIPLSGGFELQFVTFERPTPEVELSTTEEIIEQEYVETLVAEWVAVNCVQAIGYRGGRGGGGIEAIPRTGEADIYHTAREITVSATDQLLAWPIESYDWSANGQSLAGSGTVSIGQSTIAYDVADDGQSVTFTTGMGDGGSLEVELTVVEGRGLTFEKTREFTISGTYQDGYLGEHADVEAAHAISNCVPEHIIIYLLERDPLEDYHGFPEPDPFPPYDVLPKPHPVAELRDRGMLDVDLTDEGIEFQPEWSVRTDPLTIEEAVHNGLDGDGGDPVRR